MNDLLTILGTPPLADYLLEKNPATGTTLKVYVEGEKLKMMEARRRSELRRARVNRQTRQTCQVA